ncbi:MAG: DUF3010 family protein [Lentisphaeria bacterium]|jgi:hypothetical protein
MRVLGVDIHASDLVWVILDGTASGGRAENLDVPKQPFPQSENDDAGNLLRLKDIVHAVIRDKKIEKVAVLRAVDKGCSVSRCKMECVVQLAAKQASVPCLLVAPQTVASKQKKFAGTAGATMEAAFWGGKPIALKYVERATYCAWSVM